MTKNKSSKFKNDNLIISKIFWYESKKDFIDIKQLIIVLFYRLNKLTNDKKTKNFHFKSGQAYDKTYSNCLSRVQSLRPSSLKLNKQAI